MPETDNILTVGGSNYDTMTYLVQSLELKDGEFSMNSSGIVEELKYARANSAISLMKTSKSDDFIAVIFGGL